MKFEDVKKGLILRRGSINNVYFLVTSKDKLQGLFHGIEMYENHTREIMFINSEASLWEEQINNTEEIKEQIIKLHTANKL